MIDFDPETDFNCVLVGYLYFALIILCLLYALFEATMEQIIWLLT